MNPYIALIRRDLRLSLLRGSEGVTALFFYIVTATLFCIALGGAKADIAPAAPAILWVSAILSALLSLETVFHRDAEDGTFDLLLLSPLPPLGVMLAKMAAHWIVSGVTLSLTSLVLSQMLFVPTSALPVLVSSLLLGTLYMSLAGGLGATLTFGARRPGLLLALLVLPLYVPMLVAGVAGLEAALAGLPARGYLLLQLALVIAALPLASLAASACLRMNMRSS